MRQESGTRQHYPSISNPARTKNVTNRRHRNRCYNRRLLFPPLRASKKRFWTTGNEPVNRAGMGTRAIVVLLLGLTLVSVSLAEAQQPTKVPRIGFLGAASASALTGQLDAFRQGLRELGYIEGKNIVIAYDMRTVRLTVFLNLRLSWWDSRSMSLLLTKHRVFWLLKRHRQEYLSSLLCLAFQSRTGSLPASRDRAGTPQG